MSPPNPAPPRAVRSRAPRRASLPLWSGSTDRWSLAAQLSLLLAMMLLVVAVPALILSTRNAEDSARAEATARARATSRTLADSSRVHWTGAVIRAAAVLDQRNGRLVYVLQSTHSTESLKIPH